VLSIILVSIVVWFSLHKRNKAYPKSLPGIDGYLLWISTFTWATVECIFHAGEAKTNKLIASIKGGELPPTLLKMLGFVFGFLPFVVGFFYFALSPILLLMIPLSSLILCVVNGLYPPPGFLVLVSMIVGISLGFRVAVWMLLGTYQLYSWLLQINQYMILIILLLLAIAGLWDYEVIRGS
jgi:hypothetical protein